jgi:hypothetical protein
MYIYFDKNKIFTINTLYNFILRVSGALIDAIHIAQIIKRLYAAEPTTKIIIIIFFYSLTISETIITDVLVNLTFF